VGLLVNKWLKPDLLLGMWEIKEDYDTLVNLYSPDEEDMAKLDSFKNHHRKLEWLSVRILLKTLLNQQIKIVYNAERKPFLAGQPYNISISHSKNLTSVLLSKTRKVGIDLEYMSHRISAIAHKFINENEKITGDENLEKYHLYIHWCAKEALYKICDKQNINFKENLTITPFIPRKEGEITGRVKNELLDDDFTIHFFRLNNYIIAWCSK
jgi:4'-phosphopantetheinyl transferase EntD